MSAEPRGAGRDDWNRHWDAYDPAVRLNPAQGFRSRLLTDALALERAAGAVRLLDIGSGQGDFARKILASCPRAAYVGVDLSRSGVELARLKAPSARFFEGDVQSPLSLPDEYRGWATHAVCAEVLEHLDDPAKALGHVLPWLAPGGRLVVTVPGGPMSAFDRHIGHRRHYTSGDLARLLRDAGLDQVTVRGAGFPFFNVYRMAVIAQGDKLARQAGEPGFGARLGPRIAASVFAGLFRLTTARTRFGWQLVAEGTRPLGGATR
jgi:SAM-dependent methyltransferase